MSGLNETWEVLSFEYNMAYVDSGRTVYFSGDYKACQDYIATVKGGRIQKLDRAACKAQETDKETIARLLHLAPKTDHARGLNYAD